MTTKYHFFIDQASHSSVVSAMVRLAEGAADDGNEALALAIWDTVVQDLDERGEWMRLSIMVGNGNKMIGVKADSEAADRYIKKSFEAAV